jgi:hypothetical protein
MFRPAVIRGIDEGAFAAADGHRVVRVGHYVKPVAF